MSIDFEQDKQNIVEKTDLESLSNQCIKLLDLEKQIEISEDKTKELKKQYDKISSEVIPSILSEQGLQSLKLADGSTIEINKKYSCTIPKDLEKKASAYKWLRDNGLGDLIKNEVAVSFGVGEDNKAQRLLDLAAENGYQPSTKTKVEPMVLKALYRERIESGLDMPSDLFNLFIKDKTKITRK